MYKILQSTDWSFLIGGEAIQVAIGLHDVQVALERDDSSSLRRPDQGPKGRAEGPSLHKKPLFVEARSLRYASLRSASVGTTN
jgi:hypothetical protein